MKVLVVRFSSIGDIVLTSPVVRCIKQQLPNAKVHYLTKASFKATVANNKYIDKQYYLEDSLDALIPSLRKEKYDYVVDLHKNIRTTKLKKALGVTSYTFSKLNFKKWLLVNLKIDLMPDKSIVERYFEAVKPLGVRNDGQGMDYFIPKDAEITNRDIPMSHWAGYLGCVIGGAHNTKRFPVDKWIELCKTLQLPIILLGGPDDRADAERIAAVDPVRIYNACGKFSLNESASLINFARVVVTNDTGLMHISAALKKKVVSLWGNTTPKFGMFPYYGSNNMSNVVVPQSAIVENNEISCRPCSKIGFNKCPKGHFKCMQELNIDKISGIVKEYWQNSQP